MATAGTKREAEPGTPRQVYKRARARSYHDLEAAVQSGASSEVEKVFLKHTWHGEGAPMDRYPSEKMRTIVVDSFPQLGKLAALRFLEYVVTNPDGVVALPTGKTPEHFIKWVGYFLDKWEQPEVHAELKEFGLPQEKPSLFNLRFVQLDEFYPIRPSQSNSFYAYVADFYMKGFGLDPQKAMTIDLSDVGIPQGYTLETVWPDGEVDLSLRVRRAVTPLEKVQQDVIHAVDEWCSAYEEELKQLGGIGFFLGGIGPDGHIAFNIRGTDHNSTTRLCGVNYETQAAAAGDLGGMDVARKSSVVTIGLGTISARSDCVAVLLAAGEAKAKVVANAICEPIGIKYPAHALRKLPNSSFYITQGAAKLLHERRVAGIRKIGADKKVTEAMVEKALVDLCVSTAKELTMLNEQDVNRDEAALATIAGFEDGYKELAAGDQRATVARLAAKVRQTLIDKIEKGISIPQQKSFLHTEPHHDDIMLGYLPKVMRAVRSVTNTHHFICLTSGFNSVSNQFLRKRVDFALQFLKTPKMKQYLQEGYLLDDVCRRRDVWKFLDGVSAEDDIMREEGCARRFLRDIAAIYGDKSEAELEQRLKELSSYLDKQYAGAKDVNNVQILKGACREFEAECLWGHVGWANPNISHLRLGFYTSDIFAPEPTHQRDVLPVLNYLRKTRPNIVSVALDPEASGPDTHYKVLQAVTAGLVAYQKEEPELCKGMRVWGYRNVWYRFETFEVNEIIPCSMMGIKSVEDMFMTAFESQKEAEFPSPELDGPFSKLARRVWVNQYEIVKTCLGREWFQEHSSPLIRATRGLVFMRDMGLEDLLQASRAIKERQEAV